SKTCSGDAWASSEEVFSRHSTKLAAETRLLLFPLLVAQTLTIRSGSFQGMGLSRTSLTTLKNAVFMPIPRASTRITITANPGRLRSPRTAYLRSCNITYTAIQVLGVGLCWRQLTNQSHYRTRVGGA